jgi:hypothetical protein
LPGTSEDYNSVILLADQRRLGWCATRIGSPEKIRTKAACAMEGTGRDHGMFTCTLCYGISAEQPHILGRSARLACAKCYMTIINLSICWVCGELIYRGTDCVSFGWCFWHRACYGCLIYGSRKLCAGVPGSPKDGQEDGGPGRGEEVTEPPLCAPCTTECEIDGLNGDGILQKGLKRIDVVDGGVTRQRWAENTSSKDGTTAVR